MKRLFIALAIMLFAIPVLAAPPNPVENELTPLVTRGNILAAEGGSIVASAQPLVAEKAALDAERPIVNAKVAAFNRRVEAWDYDIRSRNVIIDDYNRRCAKTFPADQRAAYEACNRERSGSISRYEQENANIIAQREREKAPIQAEMNAFNQKNTALNARMEQYNNKLADYNRRKAAMIAELKRVSAKYDECQAAIDSGVRETMSSVCGRMWDGNSWRPYTNPQPVQGGMTVTPNR